MYAHATVSRQLEGERWALLQRFAGDPANWLPLPAQHLGANRWRIEVRAGSLRRTVQVTVGTSWTIPDAHGRTMTWTPVEGHAASGRVHLLPEFVGRLTLRGAEHEALTLVIEGHDEPPGGAVGRVLDDAVGHTVADATVGRLLEEVAGRLEAVAAVDTVGVPR